jgi:transposase-like protein
MRRELRLQARQLRQDGMAVTQIAKQLDVAKSCVSSWVRDIVLTPEQITQLQKSKGAYGAQNKGAQVNRQKALQLRQHYQMEGRARAKQNDPLHYGGCMLYWAEGAKARNSLQFANTDPHMLKLFMRFLREALFVTDNRIVIHIVCHAQTVGEIERIEQYWLDLLGLSSINIRKTTIKQGSIVVHNHLPNGVCNIIVYSTELLQHIFGAIQEYGGFDEPAWLG